MEEREAMVRQVRCVGLNAHWRLNHGASAEHSELTATESRAEWKRTEAGIAAQTAQQEEVDGTQP